MPGREAFRLFLLTYQQHKVFWLATTILALFTQAERITLPGKVPKIG